MSSNSKPSKYVKYFIKKKIKGAIPLCLFYDSPFLEIHDFPTFYRPIEKTKVLNDSFNRFVYKFYPQSILTLEKYSLKWGEMQMFSGQFYKKWMSVRERNIKLLLEAVTYMATIETATCIITIEIVIYIMY